MISFERGFRRLVIVVSVAVLGLGVALDAMFMDPHATVQVTLSNGRRVTLERHGPKSYLLDRRSLAEDLIQKRLQRLEQLPEFQALPPEVQRQYRAEAERRWGKQVGKLPSAPGIVNVEVLRGPEYWWWTDAVWSKIAAALVALLWACFYAVRWIARGFAPE
jgi:hypothetical protein